MAEHERAMVHMAHRLNAVELQVANTSVEHFQRIGNTDTRVSGVRDRVDAVGDALQGLAVTTRKSEQALADVHEEMRRHIEFMTSESYTFRTRLDAVVTATHDDMQMDGITADVRKLNTSTDVLERDLNELRNLCGMHAAASDLRDSAMTSMQGEIKTLEARMAALESQPRTPRSGSSSRRKSKLPSLPEYPFLEDDGYNSDDSLVSVVNAYKPIRIDFPKESEIMRFKTDMTRESLHAKMPEIKADLCDRHEKLEELLALPAHEWRGQLDKDPQLLEADRFIRRLLRAIPSGDGDELRVWKSDERDLRANDYEESKYGRALFERMEDRATFTRQADIRKMRTRIEKNEPPYVTVNMTEVQVTAAHRQMRDDVHSLPRAERGHLDLIRLLIQMTPTELREDASRSFADRLDDEIREHERGKHASTWVPKYTFQTLSEVIAGRIHNTAGNKAVMGVQPGNMATQGGKPAACWNCGKMDCEFTTCTVRCSLSGIKGCGCCRGAKCWMKLKNLPRRQSLKMAEDREINTSAYNKMTKWRKDNPDKIDGYKPGAAPTAGAGAPEAGTDAEPDATGAPAAGRIVAVRQNLPTSVSGRPGNGVVRLPRCLPIKHVVLEPRESTVMRHGARIAGGTPDTAPQRPRPTDMLEDRERAAHGWIARRKSEPEVLNASCADSPAPAKIRLPGGYEPLSFDANGDLLPPAPRHAPEAYVGMQEATRRLHVAAEKHGLLLEEPRAAPAAVAHHAVMITQKPAERKEGAIIAEFLLDTGAEVPLVVMTPDAMQLAHRRVPDPTGVSGVGGSSDPTELLTFHASLPGINAVFELTAYGVPPDAPGVVCNVISHSGLRKLLCAHQPIIRYEPEMTIFTDAGETRVGTDGKTYVVELVLASSATVAREVATACDEQPAVQLNAAMPTSLQHAAMPARVRADDHAHLMAARYGVNADNLPKLSKAVDGINCDKITRASALLIDTDEALRRSQHHRRSTGSAPSRHLRLVLAGNVFILDWWPSSIECKLPAPFLGANGVMHAWDKLTGYGHATPSSDHTMDSWLKYAVDIVATEKAIGHEVLVFVVDADGAFAPDNTARFEAATGARVVMAAGDDHEFLTVGEARMDPITRRTEAAMLRARAADPPVPEHAMVACRVYTVIVNNDVPAAGSRLARIHHYKGSAPSARSSPKPLFWTRGSVTAIGAQQGPKGIMTETRSSRERTARLYGARSRAGLENAFLLLACDTKKPITRHPSDFDPLDEHVLLRAGIAAGGTVHEMETQTEVSAQYPIMSLPMPMPPKIVTKEIVKYKLPDEEQYAVGDALEVLWQDAKGDTHRWWPATVVEIIQVPTDAIHHVLEYATWEGKDKRWKHEIAKDRVEGLHQYRRVKARAEPKSKPPPAEGLRRSTRHRKMVAMVEQIIDASDLTFNSPTTFDVMLNMAFGSVGDGYASAEHENVTQAMTRLYQDARDPDSDEAHKLIAAMETRADHDDAQHLAVMATKPTPTTEVEIQGEKCMLTPPKTVKQLLAAPDSAEWMVEEKAAFHDAIMRLPDNSIIPEAEAKKLSAEFDVPISHFVTVRGYKMSAMRKLRRKVRHSVDQARGMRRASPKQRMKVQQYRSYTMPATALEGNCFMSSVQPDEVLCLLDWKNAYGIGETGRDFRLVYPPPSLDVLADDGTPGVVFLGGPIWGESAAGYEFEETRNEDMEDAGWPRVADVPSLFWHATPDSTGRGCAIIDDLALRVPFSAGGYDEVMRLAAFLSARAVARGGEPVVVTKAPDMWGGVRISRDDKWMTLTITMTDHIVKSVSVWLPSLVDDGCLPPDVPVGAALRRGLDSLYLMQGDGKLEKYQKDFQSITGDLRWMLRCLIQLTRKVHMMSCVAARCSPGGRSVALGVLAEAYEHRHSGITWGGSPDNEAIEGVLTGSVDPRLNQAIEKVDGAARLRDGAPVLPEGTSDATWSLGVEGGDDVFCLCITNNGASVLTELKKAGVKCGSSAEVEGLGLLRLSDKAIWTKIICARLGVSTDMPMRLLCDAEAALRACSGEQSVARMRHVLRRAAIVTQRVRAEEVRLAHVPDATNWADIFTKWVKQVKFDKCLAYMNGAVGRHLYGTPFPNELKNKFAVHVALAMMSELRA